ncbi:Kinesin-like protein KIF3B [Schistosoma japonicum]|nr:Kinesin-like protein KIF3B [Schistosoma japonicum]
MKEKKIQEEQLETRQLESKLRAMESKLLCGDKSIAEHTRMQEVTLAQQRIQLAEQKRREREIVARMEEEVGSMANLQEGFTSLKQEVEVNTRKLKRLFEKLQEVKEQTSDIQEEHTIERQEHEKIQDQLTREVKLQLLILENFIPTEEKEKLEKRIYFDGETERWQLKPLFQSTIENTNISISSRFQSEHLLNLDMDLTGRTTNDYEPPELAPQVVAALEVALQDEEDLELDGRY